MKLIRTLALLLCLAMLLSTFVACANTEDGADDGMPPAQLVDPRMKQTLLSTEHFKITVAMMSYMVYSEYQSLVSTYNQYSQQIGFTVPIPGGNGGNALDQSKMLREQTYATKDEAGNALATPMTWFDYFAQRAKEDLKRMLAVCEVAHKLGKTLSEAELAAIESSLKNLESYASYYGYETEAYVAALYGKGVTVADVREMMKIMQLANTYNDEYVQGILDSVTEQMILEEYEKFNLGDEENRYDTFVDYISFDLSCSFKPSTAKDAETARAENEANAAIYEQTKQKYKEMADALASTSPEQFEEKLYELCLEILLEQERDKALSAKGEGETLSEEEEAACLTKAQEGAADTVKGAVLKNVDVNASSTSPEFHDWMMDEGATRGEGDIFMNTGEYDAFGNVVGSADAASTEYKSVSSRYSVYLLKSGLHRDEEVLRTVGHILFTTDTYKDKISLTGLTGPVKTLAVRVLERVGVLSAKEMAKELVTLMQEEGKITQKTVGDNVYYVVDQEVFKAYGEQYTEDGNVFYEDVYKGQMVETFENWLFDEARVEGEISIEAVETPYGYHVMMYCGNEKQVWSETVKSNVAEREYDAWMAQIMDAASYTSGEASLWSLIEG